MDSSNPLGVQSTPLANDVNWYKAFIGEVETFFNTLLETFSKELGGMVHTAMNSLFAFLIVLYIVNRVKNQDLVERKHLVMIAVFLGYLVFYNWSIKNPTQSQQEFFTLIETPANMVSSIVQKADRKINGYIGNINSSLKNRSFIVERNIQKTWESFSQIVDKMWDIKIGISNILKPLICFLFIGSYLIANVALFVFIMLYIVISFLEYTIYKLFYVLFIPLVFFQQTRGFAWTYVKKLVSLTFYMPLIMVVSSFNMVGIDYALGNLDLTAFVNNNHANIASILMHCVFAIILTIILILLAKKIPDVINAIFGTQGTIADAGNMISNIVQTGGMVGAAVAGMAKRGYVNASGGQGGAMGVAKGVIGAVGNSALGVATGGVSHLAQEGVSKASNMLKPKISVERFSAPNRDWE
ncbi:type IV secretion system protein [Helicobacter cetorum]|uniref:type IV secretion system protein n=1 Tax=Helicobacter cetorum TaxID=138563 RepID=UPI000CF0B35A|nr:type IV secretion system protein [Helicobacter cetorum]